MDERLLYGRAEPATMWVFLEEDRFMPYKVLVEDVVSGSRVVWFARRL